MINIDKTWLSCFLIFQMTNFVIHFKEKCRIHSMWKCSCKEFCKLIINCLQILIVHREIFLKQYNDLARAKSEALVNILIIYSNKKIKSCNAKRRRQREQQKKSIGVFSSALFSYIFYDVVLHGYNVKLPSYTSYEGSVVHVCAHQKFCCLCSCSLFFTAARFHLADH